MNATAVTDVLYNVNSFLSSRPSPTPLSLPSASAFRAFLIFYIPPHPVSQITKIGIFIVFIYQRLISQLARNFEDGGYT